jgi:hypothetical protein
MTTRHRLRALHPAPAVVALALAVAACGSAAAPPSAPAASPPDASRPAGPTPVPMPSVPADGSITGPGGGGNPGNPGAGGGGGVDPGPGGVPDDSQATIVTPVAGLLGIRDVGAASLRAAVDGHRVSVKLAWWSGVEPCSVFAGVDVVRDGSTFTLTVREGSALQGVACIEIAKFKAAIVDLGELDPGTYTLRAFGDIPPIEVTVTG